MGNLSNPVMMWRDAGGGYTGALLGDWASAAHGAGEAAVLAQLKALLEWRQVHEPWGVDADIVEPSLVEYRVDIRAEYQSEDDRRTAPCPELLPFRVPCVVGAQENGLRVCVVPHLGLRFTYDESAELRALVQHYVIEALQGLTPLELARALPPMGPYLAEIQVPHEARVRSVPWGEREEIRALVAVGDPLLSDRGRGSLVAAHGREELATELARRLAGERNNLLLVGEAGVGKSTLLRDAARRSLRDANSTKEESDADSNPGSSSIPPRYWRSSAARIISGMSYLGQWEERCEEVIQQLARVDGVLCIERLLELIQVGGVSPADSVASFLLPYLQRGELRIVAESTPEELDACRRWMPGLLDVFQVVSVPVFDSPTCRSALERVAQAYAKAAKVDFPSGGCTLVQQLFTRFQPYATLPGPAVDFLRSLIHEASGSSVPKRGGDSLRELTASRILSAFAQRTGLPESLLRDDLPLDLGRVRSHFEEQIVGQPVAIQTAVRVVASIKAGLTDPSRPSAVLLFCGPTGVGKTALAQALAAYCFGAAGQKDRLVRLDLSEFSGPLAARRLVQGMAGEPADWLQKVRAQPFCVVLFDEIEKAAPEVFDVLLGVLDEGRLTDTFGRVTHFRSAIVILTSNLGSSQSARMGFGLDSGPDYDAEVQKFFRPEFFNRLDSVVAFNALTPEDVRKIVRKEFGEIRTREGIASLGLELEWERDLEEAIARAGYDHRLGTRPLQRALERMVVVPLARWLLQFQPTRGSRLNLSLGGDGLLRVSAVAGG